MRYLRKCKGKIRRDRIRNNQIRKILSQDLVTKMVDKRELRRFGHIIGWIAIGDLDEYGKRVEMARGRGRPRREREEHMRKMTKKSEELTRGDETGEDQEGVPDLTDAT